MLKITASIFILSVCSVLQAAPPSDQPINQPMGNHSWSQFGGLSEAYVAGRRGYPDAAFDPLQAHLSSDAAILDLGCGTGIATRQLRSHGFTHLIGGDRDELMLKEAEKANQESTPIEYRLCDVTKGLPFPQDQFDAVTAFSAFHWFADPSSTREVMRVLKPGGYYFIVNRMDNSHTSLDKPIYAIIEKTAGQKRPDTKVDAAAAVEAEGFKIIINTAVTSVESYTKEQYLSRLQSLSSWNFVKDSPKVDEVIEQINTHLETIADDDGMIRRTFQRQVVLAQKPV